MTTFPTDTPAFWQAFDELVATSQIVIDRPKNSAHPRYADLIYPLDYGYLQGTTAGDGDGIDVWLGSGEGKRVVAIACTVDRFKRDTEIKVLLDCSEGDLQTISHFLNVVAEVPCIIIGR